MEGKASSTDGESLVQSGMGDRQVPEADILCFQ